MNQRSDIPGAQSVEKGTMEWEWLYWTSQWGLDITPLLASQLHCLYTLLGLNSEPLLHWHLMVVCWKLCPVVQYTELLISWCKFYQISVLFAGIDCQSYRFFLTSWLGIVHLSKDILPGNSSFTLAGPTNAGRSWCWPIREDVLSVNRGINPWRRAFEGLDFVERAPWTPSCMSSYKISVISIAFFNSFCQLLF